MSDEQQLIEVPCPDCVNPLNTIIPAVRMFQAKCPTCNGKGKVLVDRKDLIKLG